ncbi:MAG: T9SS type A sorting domain-containing protein [bacterium]
MNKILPLLIVIWIVLTIQESNCQTFELITPLSDTDTVRGLPEQDRLISYSEVKNISANTASYKIALAPITLTEGHLFSICDCENCYMPQETYFQTPNPCPLAPEETSGGSIYLDLIPNNTEGTSIINVNFFNVDNQTDNVLYQAIFVVGPVDVNETIKLTLLPADVIPNPATDRVIINNIPVNSTGKLKIDIFDSKGNLTNSELVDNTIRDYELNTSNFLTGVYYYNITISGKAIKTGSFVISK